MRKSDVEMVLDTIKLISDYTKTMDFKTSSYINQQVVKIVPVLENEVKRLETEKTVINSPKILLIGTEDLTGEQTLVDTANLKMSELVENGYKIVDFGLFNGKISDLYVYIKYTD